MLGVPVLGLIGLLLLAVERKCLPIPEAEKIVSVARQRGFRVADRFARSFQSRLRALSDHQ